MGIQKRLGHIPCPHSVYRPLFYITFLEITSRLGIKLLGPNEPTQVIYHCGTGRNWIFLPKTWTHNRDLCLLSLPFPECTFCEVEIIFCCLLLHLYCLEQCLAQGRCSVDICWINRWMAPYLSAFNSNVFLWYSSPLSWFTHSLMDIFSLEQTGHI